MVPFRNAIIDVKVLKNADSRAKNYIEDRSAVLHYDTSP